MNLGLIDPTKLFPEYIEDCLEYGHLKIASFNPFGTLLATGCYDGKIVIWDFDTKVAVRKLIGHKEAVNCLAWSENGKLLYSGSNDKRLIIWDLTDSSKNRTELLFDDSVNVIEIIEKTNHFIACVGNSVFLLDANSRTKLYEYNRETEKKETEKNERTKKEKLSDYSVVAAAIPKSTQVIIGCSDGNILIFEAISMKLLNELKLTHAIKGISCSPDGTQFVVNSTDRTIRVFLYDGSNVPTPTLKFKDVVNSISWDKAKFSNTGDFIVGGAGGNQFHNLYFWDKQAGNLSKILEGAKDGFRDFVYHPTRQIIASVSSFGMVYIWSTTVEEHWSAFAADFIEVETNVEYEEKEDEFDYVPECEVDKQKKLDEDEVVDVVTNDVIYTADDPNPLIRLCLDTLSDDETEK